jgi:hypothetical protein
MPQTDRQVRESHIFEIVKETLDEIESKYGLWGIDHVIDICRGRAEEAYASMKTPVDSVP